MRWALRGCPFALMMGSGCCDGWREGSLMALTEHEAREVLDVCIRARKRQDRDLIMTIFTP